jgi:GNAT superfamily N-acetyltransferase
MRDRLFVLAPLSDLAAHLVPPGWRETVGTARHRRGEAEGTDAVVPVGAWSAADRGWIGPSGQPIEIRRPRLEEAEEAARTHTASADAAYRGYAPREPGALARRTGLWREILSNGIGQSFVAVDDGRIVGVLHVGSFRDEPALGAVQVLYVRPEWWGSGAGQLLLDCAHAELAKTFDEAQLTVLTGNRRARRFYERNGWRLTETLVEPHFGGHDTEVCRYRRRLRE